MSPPETHGALPDGLIAMSEDGDQVWYVRTLATRTQARRRAAADWDTRWWKLKAYPDHMRPHDCAADHDGDLADDVADRLDRGCGLVDEGWHHQCQPDHPAAIACWLVEYRGMPTWWYRARHRLARLHPGYRDRHRAPALWGGRVERRATLLDRILIPHAVSIVGSPWHRPHQGEIRWCNTCRQFTLHHHYSHQPARVRYHCAAEQHFGLRMREIDRKHPVHPRQEAP